MAAAYAVNPADLVPEIARQVLARKGLSGADEAFVETIEAVVLLADLSGFSQLGARFVERSDRGAEELRALINRIFEQVVRLINDHGGSVLHYAGDAVAAAWPCEYAEFPTLVERATHCGLAIQAACEKLSDELLVHLEMRASVAAGPIHAVHLPRTDAGPQILLCGGVLSSFAAAESAERGIGVRLSEACYAAIQPTLDKHARYHRQVDGARIFALAGALDPKWRARNALALHAGKYVQSSLRELLSHASSEWLAEFRPVNILFARFPSFECKGPEDLDTCHDLACEAISAVAEYGGTLIQFCNDDKGLVLLAGWGLASSSFENGAERALGAAIALEKAVARVGYKTECAVTGGKVFAGLVGAHPLYQYVMVGDAVNRAAAMAVASASSLIFDEAIREAVARRYASVERERLKLKGYAAPVPAYALASERLAGVSHRGDLIGRAQERARLESICSDYVAGSQIDIHIIGDAGLGKSRLTAWFEGRLAETGVECIRMNADSLRQSTGFIPWRQVFASLLGFSPQATPVECRAAVQNLLSEDEQSLALLPLLNPILPATLPDTEFTAGLSGSGRAESTRNVMLALLKAALHERAAGYRDSTVLLIEDAHWLDSASWQLAEAAGRLISGLSLLIVTRPLDTNSLPTETRRLFDPGAAEVFDLGPLSRDDSGELITQTLNVRETAPQIVDLVYREAEGNPLYTTALTLALRDRGLMAIDGAYAHLKLGESGISHISFPYGVEGVITERISALPPSQQLDLKVASVLGRTFDLEAAVKIHPNRPTVRELRDDMEKIVATGLIEAAEGERELYRFHHAIIADSAYRMLVTDQRHLLHKAAGLVTEDAIADGTLEQDQASLAIMAHHFEQAGDAARALNYLAQAATAAQLGYNNVEVVDFLTRALIVGEDHSAAPDRVTIGDWKYRIGEALRALGQYQRAEKFLRESAGTLDRAPPETNWQAMKALAKGYIDFRMRPHRAAQPDEIRIPLLTAAAANMTLSEIHYELNKVPLTLCEILRGTNLAREAGGDSETLAKLYMGLALVSTVLPSVLDGDELQRQSLAITDRIDDPALISWVYMVSGNYEMGKGSWETGNRHLIHACEAGERCGERKNWETAMSCLGNIKRLEGRFEEAKGWSDLTLAASRDRGVVHQIIWSHNGRARDLLCMSRIDEVREEVAALNRLLDDPTKRGDANDNNNLVFLYARSFCALDSRDDQAARASLDALMEIVTRTKRPQVYMIQNVDYYSDIIWNLWRRGHRDGLLAHQALVVKSGRKVAKQYRTGLPMAELAAGDNEWYLGKAEKALKHWVASAEAARERGMLYSAAHALFRIEEAGLAHSGDASLDWRPLVERLKIPRPVLWSMA